MVRLQERAMPISKSVKTLVREDLVYNLEQINGGSTYHNKIADVFCDSRSLDKIEEYPSIFVDFTEYQVTTENYYQIDFSAKVSLVVCIEEENDPVLAREQIIQDIETKLFENMPERSGFLPDSQGNCRVRAVLLDSISYEGSEETKPKYYIKINLSLEFSQKPEDPSLTI